VQALAIISGVGECLYLTKMELLADPDDGSRSTILRYCKAVLAWLRAGLSLSRSKLFRHPSPKLHLVPSNVRQVDENLEDLMIRVILPRLCLSLDTDHSTLIQQLLLREDFVKKPNLHSLRGHTHGAHIFAFL
jgi:hypothetical protein